MRTFPKRKQIRLKEYDYSNNGVYFVTVCSYKRSNIFAEVKDVESVLDVKLSIIGEIIKKQWTDISNQYENVDLGQFCIMPNHMHGILIIMKREETSPSPTMSDIICSFKSKSTRAYIDHLKQNNTYFSVNLWQRSFHDHIIRNEKSFNKINEYIINNRYTWDQDENNPNSRGGPCVRP